MQHATENVQQTRSNGQQCRRRHARGNVQGTTAKCATGIRRHATCNRGKCNRRHAACNRKHPDNMRRGKWRATDNMQTTCAMQRTTCSSERHAAPHKQRAACTRQHVDIRRQAQRTKCSAQQDGTQRATDNMQDSMQHALCSGRIACSMQQATCSMQQTTDSVEKTTGSVRRTTDKKAIYDRRPAACSRHRAEKHTANNRERATGNACSRQRTTDSRRHARGREHMRDATRTPRHRRVSCAAGSGEPAACAKHCTRQPVRNKAQTPHTRCNIRPVPQHATTTYENTRGTTNEVRKLAHLGALSGSLAALDLGRGLTARFVRRLRAPLTSCSRRLRRADSRSFASATS